jgi:hypothetical protein
LALVHFLLQMLFLAFILFHASSVHH